MSNRHDEPEVPIPVGLVAALEAHLAQLAARRETTHYLAVARALAVRPPHHLRKVMRSLEELASRHHAAGQPLLSALVVSRVRAPIPAPGFFAHLATLGAYAGAEEGEEARRWHQAEIARIFAG